MTDLIVKSGVTNALGGYQVSDTFYDAPDAEVAALSEDAARRTEANGRSTVQPRDL